MSSAHIDPAMQALASDLVLGEGEALDRQAWAGWLAMYREDASFWVPAWVDEHETTSDPDTQVSLIYHTSRWELEERIGRIQSRKSIVAMPLPRTLHVIGAVRVSSASAETLATCAAAMVYSYDVRTASPHMAAVRYEHRFVRDGAQGWLIAAKKIVLINDRMPAVVDFYTL